MCEKSTSRAGPVAADTAEPAVGPRTGPIRCECCMPEASSRSRSCWSDSAGWASPRCQVCRGVAASASGAGPGCCSWPALDGRFCRMTGGSSAADRPRLDGRPVGLEDRNGSARVAPVAAAGATAPARCTSSPSSAAEAAAAMRPRCTVPPRDESGWVRSRSTETGAEGPARAVAPSCWANELLNREVASSRGAASWSIGFPRSRAFSSRCVSHCSCILTCRAFICEGGGGSDRATVGKPARFRAIQASPIRLPSPSSGAWTCGYRSPASC